MGILDDAIREHLELKRRAGADAAEIARLERSAFGADEAPAAHPPADVQAEAAAPVEAPVEVAAAEPVEHVEPAPVEPEPEPVALEPEPVEQPTRQFTLEELEDAERRDAAPPAAEEEPAPAPAPQTQEELDELEETPDFLQETPEHDRLWFEQKPPKDFDF